MSTPGLGRAWPGPQGEPEGQAQVSCAKGQGSLRDQGQSGRLSEGGLRRRTSQALSDVQMIRTARPPSCRYVIKYAAQWEVEVEGVVQGSLRGKSGLPQLDIGTGLGHLPPRVRGPRLCSHWWQVTQGAWGRGLGLTSWNGQASWQVFELPTLPTADG